MAAQRISFVASEANTGRIRGLGVNLVRSCSLPFSVLGSSDFLEDLASMAAFASLARIPAPFGMRVQGSRRLPVSDSASPVS